MSIPIYLDYNATTNANVVELGTQGIEAGHQIAQTLATGQLRVDHA